MDEENVDLDVITIDDDNVSTDEAFEADVTIDDDSGVDKRKERTVDPELIAARAELAALRATANNRQPERHAVQHAPAVDDLQARENDLQDKRKALGVEYESIKDSPSLTEAKLAELEQRSNSIDSDLGVIRAQKALRLERPNIQRQSQADENARKYGDVYQNRNATRYAEGQYHMMLAEGAPEGAATVEKAMNKARIQYRMVKGVPTDNDRAQMSGVGNGGGRRRAPDNSFKFNKSLSIIASEMFGDRVGGDLKKSQQMWAKEVGIPARRRAEADRNKRRNG